MGDFNGDGRDEIVAGDRAEGKVASSHIFYSVDESGKEWHHEELDHMGMSASGCQIADINGDGRPDIVMIGGATANIKWYENPRPARSIGRLPRVTEAGNGCRIPEGCGETGSRQTLNREEGP